MLNDRFFGIHIRGLEKALFYILTVVPLTRHSKAFKAAHFVSVHLTMQLLNLVAIGFAAFATSSPNPVLHQHPASTSTSTAIPPSSTPSSSAISLTNIISIVEDNAAVERVRATSLQCHSISPPFIPVQTVLLMPTCWKFNSASVNDALQ